MDGRFSLQTMCGGMLMESENRKFDIKQVARVKLPVE